MNITESVHPEYLSQLMEWQKYRLIMSSGDDFLRQYVRKFSVREDDTDFANRVAVTPVPAFAYAAILDIQNAIFQRLTDIIRYGGSTQYHAIITGQHGGVDLLGSTMNYYIGNEILPELLFMGKVGIYIDMPEFNQNTTLYDTQTYHPYCYTFKTEQIRNWRLARYGEIMEFDMLLLEERILTYDSLYALPEKDQIRYRLLIRDPESNTIWVRFYNQKGEQVDQNGQPTQNPIQLNITRIPFILLELRNSLLKNIANHQIALTNLESSDIGYALKSNFPFYIEQETKTRSPHLKTFENEEGKEQEIEVGGMVGRTYPPGANPPMFINPPSEPLTASMEKQKQLKDDIRVLVNLSLSTTQSRYASAESKSMDERGLESGLSFIGLLLEHSERLFASLYAEYEGSSNVAQIQYPERYALKSDLERLNEAKNYLEIINQIPSRTAKIELSKIIASKILDTKIAQETLNQILHEIDTSPYVSSDPEKIHADLEHGLVSNETASQASGYLEGEVKKAEIDHAKRIKRIQDAQSPGSRGVDDLEINAQAAKEEKTESQNSDIQEDSKKAVRGKE